MNIRLIFLIPLLSLSPVVGAQTAASGGVSGVESDGQVPWVRWARLETRPFHAERWEAGVTPGSFVVDWDAFTASWTGVGWTLTSGPASTVFTAGAPGTGTVKGRWAGTDFGADVSSPWTFSVVHQWNHATGGGWAAGAGGGLQTPEPFDLGPWSARGWGAWAGWDSWTAFYGEVSGEVRASRNLFLWSFEGHGQAEARWAGLSTQAVWPLWWLTWEWSATMGYAEGRLQATLGRNLLGQGQWKTAEESRLRGGAGWLDQSWRIGDWTWGLGSGAAVFWVENPTWTQTHAWTETHVVWWWPFFETETLTSSTDFTLEASPGWVVILRPRVTWTLFPHTALTVSRWLPVSGGIHLAIDASPVAGPTGAGTGGPSDLSVRNLWLAGTQVEFSASW